MTSKHPTYWEVNKKCNKYPSKRYVVIFDIYRNYASKNQTYTEYDTIEEYKEETNLINEFYKDTPRPVKVKNKYNTYTYEFPINGYFWGYIVLDMVAIKLIEIGNDGIKISLKCFDKWTIKKKSDFNTELRDFFFRKESEIPKNYIFDDGEYEGWLQFRWGDGKNAINKPKKEPHGVIEYREIYDNETDSYIKKKVRVVYVDWNDPLPKKERGVIYERPNKEPVIFPGDFGYEGDYALQEWSLAEEIAHEEYKETKNTLSLADVLGDNNPLLKLKFD